MLGFQASVLSTYALFYMYFENSWVPKALTGTAISYIQMKQNYVLKESKYLWKQYLATSKWN